MNITKRVQCSHFRCHSREGRKSIVPKINLDSVDAWTDDLAYSLVENHVHVWFVRLADYTGCQEKLTTSLSPDEKNRASRFFRPIDRERFVLRRGLLRHILGKYTGLTPSKLRFNYGGNGKPALISSFGGQALRFNLSHSNGVAVYAMTKLGEVGVDVEAVRDFPDWQDIVVGHFSLRERTVLQNISEAQKLEAFYRGWTRKEAFLKATGQGIGNNSLRYIEVSLEPDKTAKIYKIKNCAKSARKWVIADLKIYPGFVGALALKNNFL